MKHVAWKDVEIVKAEAESAEICFSTERFTYTIHAEANVENDYLGCTCFENRRRRGRDLADGRLTDETWKQIHLDIAENEFLQGRSPEDRHR